MTIRSSLHTALADAASTLDAFRRDVDQMANLDAFVTATRETLESECTLLACGNGGSMSQAIHFAEEWVGRFRQTRRALPAIALGDPSALTCIANDFGFDEVFARQVEAHGRAGDLLLLLSTSGNSANTIRAARVARERGLRSVALLGQGGGTLAGEVDIPIVIPLAATSDRIQELHLHILHSVIEAVERELFPAQYSAERG